MVSCGGRVEYHGPSIGLYGIHDPGNGKKHILGHLHIKTKSISRKSAGEKKIKTMAACASRLCLASYLRKNTQKPAAAKTPHKIFLTWVCIFVYERVHTILHKSASQEAL
jgi:hypothetical protein